MIFHITTAAAWEASRDAYEADSLASEGFIHLSTAEQLPFVAEKFFQGHTGLVVLHVDPARLKSPLVYEAAEPGMPPFPHLYGPLNLDAVVEVSPR